MISCSSLKSGLLAFQRDVFPFPCYVHSISDIYIIELLHTHMQILMTHDLRVVSTRLRFHMRLTCGVIIEKKNLPWTMDLKINQAACQSKAARRGRRHLKEDNELNRHNIYDFLSIYSKLISWFVCLELNRSRCITFRSSMNSNQRWSRS